MDNYVMYNYLLVFKISNNHYRYLLFFAHTYNYARQENYKPWFFVKYYLAPPEVQNKGFYSKMIQDHKDACFKMSHVKWTKFGHLFCMASKNVFWVFQ